MENLLQYINVPYLITFMALTYLVKTYFKTVLNRLFQTDLMTVYVVLILATLVGIVYWLGGADWQKLLPTYAVGTSLHELIFKRVEEKIKEKQIVANYYPGQVNNLSKTENPQ